MADKDFVICGYETGNMVSLILGEYREGQLIYAGTVTMGVRRPKRVCTVEYMPNTLDVLRKPVFKGIRDDETVTI